MVILSFVQVFIVAAQEVVTVFVQSKGRAKKGEGLPEKRRY
jgi:hypothetical protein